VTRRGLDGEALEDLVKHRTGLMTNPLPLNSLFGCSPLFVREVTVNSGGQK
jgi:hypothetical protein